MRTLPKQIVPRVLPGFSCLLLLAALLTSSVLGVEISAGQFSGSDPVITFETGSTALPGIPGLELSGGDATFSFGAPCFGNQYFGNINGATYLDVSFDQPKQAVGAYVIETSPFYGVTGVIEIAYDQNGNIIETESSSFPYWPSSPAFLGIGEPTAQIYRVEWRYIGAAAGSGYFGVDNVIYGAAIGLDQIPEIPTGLSATHQDLQVALSWSSSPRASTYNVKRAIQIDGPYTTVITGTSSTNHADSVSENGLYYYVISAVNAYGESANSQPLTVYVLDHFKFEPIPQYQTSGIPFNVTVSACDSNDFRVLNFNGTAMLSGSGDHGNLQLSPTTLQFISGQWTGMVTIASAYPDTNIRLTCASNSVVGVSSNLDASPPGIQEFDVWASDLVYSSFARRIYATIPAAATNFSNCLLVIDPMLGRIETNYFLGDDPQKMALSDDGQFLYVAFYGSNVVRRFDTSTHSIGLEISLGQDAYGSMILPVALAVLPGQPHSYAVSAGGLRIFDDAVERTNSLAIQGPILSVSPLRVYTGPPFTRVTLNSSGVVSSDSHDGYMGYYDSLKYEAGLVFTSSGEVFDPESLVIRGFLSPCSIVEPDLANGRVFTMASYPVWAHPDAWTLLGSDPISLQPIGSLALDGILGGSPISLIRWGTNGFAISMSQIFSSWNQVFLIRTSLVPAFPPADLSLWISGTPPSIALYSNLTYSIQITNRGPSDAQVAAFRDVLPQGVTLISANSTLGTCVLSNGVVTCSFGILSNGATATVTLSVTPTIIAQLTNIAVVSCSSFDPDMSNNSSVTIIPCQDPPFAATQQPWIQSSSSVSLNGMAVANGLDTSGWFEWGVRGHFDGTTPPTSLGAGSAVNHVSAVIDGLTNGIVYQCRLVVSNASGLATGGSKLFSTGRKIVAWGDNSGGQLNIPLGMSNVVSLAAGRYHSLGLLSDGTVLAWGTNTYGQLNVPIGLNDVVAIAANDSDCLALKSDGTVVGWGQNYAGQANVPWGLGEVIAISQGPGHNLALRSDGTVAAWGDNSAGECSVPPGLNSVVAISAGFWHSEALKADGTVVCWGWDQLQQTEVPNGLADVIAVTAGYGFSAALRSDGTVIKWPGGVISNLTNEVAIAGNFGNLLALEKDGSVDFGAPPGLSNTCILAAGVVHGLADGDNFPPVASSLLLSSLPNQDLVITLQGSDLNADILSYRITTLPSTGALYQFTNGGRGPMIDTTNVVVADPGNRVLFESQGSDRTADKFTYVVNDGEVDSVPATVSLNIGNTFASTQPATQITANGATLNGMALPNGMNSVAWFEWAVPGQHLNPTSAQVIGSGAGVVRITQKITGLVQPAVYQFRLVVSNASGTIYGAPNRFTTGEKVAVWGGSLFGLNSVPQQLGYVVGIAAGYGHNLALRPGGTVVAWGDNSYDETNLPSGLGNVVALAAGDGNSLALTSDGTVVGWGRNNYGQGSAPQGVSNVVAIAAGEEHDLALLVDGTVIGWGRNDYGQASIPAGLSNAVAIAAGQFQSVALKADGTVLEWGNAPQPPAALTNLVAVAAGDSHTLALSVAGSVSAWGSNSLGQTDIPASAFGNVLGIGRGVYHSFAITSDGGLVAWGDNDFGQALAPAGLNHVVAASGGVHNSIVLGGNVPPEAISQVTNGPANRDLVIICQTADVNGDPVTARIASLPAVGSLYQYLAGTRGSAILVNNTIINDPVGRVIFVPLVNGFGSPYAIFNFIANDGQIDSKPSAIVVNVAQTVVPVLSVSPWQPSSPFTLTLTADSNMLYAIWASTNLVDWSFVGPANPLSNGWFQFSDPGAAEWPLRFYKAKSQ